MHPDDAFRFRGDAAALDWALVRSFAHVCVAGPDGPRVAHAPIVAAGAGAVRFHVARANAIAPLLDGARVALSIAGADGYVTPGWYADPVRQVPTWNYVAVEIEGVCRATDDDALTAQLDALAAANEPRVAPDRPWSRGKMDDGRFRAMLRAIIGFEVTVERVRGTCKLSQNKSDEDKAGVIAGLARSGNPALADLMAAPAADGERT